ncbi:Predicted nucleoside ABC transporter, permease 1 component [hydrothermal vent metagenome]|uniref:Predicted nucleoside ABC transporter, permease 1 component n=1 Tax=hydrothermal vent metagenome TaxID=652676 RepID=A0A3B0U7X1_9ZZZZ
MIVRKPLPRWADLVLIPALNLTLAFLVSGLVVLAIGENPLKAVGILLYGAFGYGEGLGYTLHFATNFVFSGLAFAVASHAGQFNIGAEGQAYVAGLGAIMVGLALDQTSWMLVLPVAMLAAGAIGGFWGFIPGYLAAKRGSHVVITTIMFNFIAAAFMVYMLNRVLKPADQMAPESRSVVAAGKLPQLREFWDFFGYSPVNVMLFVAIGALIFTYILLWHTEFGYKVRALGLSPNAAHYAGISNSRITIIAMTISGALAGMIAVNEVLGVQNRLVMDFVFGYGFVGIAVGLMGRNHPIGIGLAAILFGALYQGGQELAFSMPAVTREMILVIQALVILFTGAMEGLFRAPLETMFTMVELSRKPKAATGNES